MSKPHPAHLLNQMLTGFWLSQAIYVAAKLALSDLLHQEPQTAAELATKVGVQPEGLFRLLRALASVGIYAEQLDGRFTMTPLAAELRSDVPGSKRALAIMSGEEHYASWGDLLYTVRTGKPAFDKVFGEPIFDWLSKHAEQAAVFDAAMVSVHGRETSAMVEAYDFSEIGTLADVGGGNGSVLRGVLAKNPNVRGMLCDLPGVLERAQPLIAAEGLAGRLQTFPTNFFEAVPPGADVYMMRHIIHDWTEEQSLIILRNIRKVIREDGRLLVIESIIPPGNEPSFGKLLDLNMMVIPGGKERTEVEYRDLFGKAGFRLERIVPTAAEVSVIEGLPI
jgi:hypothetical protein